MIRVLVLTAVVCHLGIEGLSAQFPREIYDPGKLPRWKTSFADSGLQWFEIDTLVMAHSSPHIDCLRNDDLIAILGCSNTTKRSVMDIIRTYDKSRRQVFDAAKEEDNREAARKRLRDVELKTNKAIYETLDETELDRLAGLISIQMFLDHSLPINDELMTSIVEFQSDIDRAISKIQSGQEEISNAVAEAVLGILEPGQVDKLTEMAGEPKSLFKLCPDILYLQLETNIENGELGKTPGWLPKPRVYVANVFGALKVQDDQSPFLLDHAQPIIALLTVPGIAKELELVGEQVTIGALYLQASKQLESMRNTEDDQTEEQFKGLLKEFGDEAVRQIETVLLPHQIVYLRQLANQYRARVYGPVNMILTDHWAKELDLSAEQSKELAAKQNELQRLIQSKSQHLETDAWRMIRPALYADRDDRRINTQLINAYIDLETYRPRVGVLLNALTALNGESQK